MSVNNANGLARSQRDRPRPTTATARPAKAEEGETESETPDLNDPLLLLLLLQLSIRILACLKFPGHCIANLNSRQVSHIKLHLSFEPIAPISRCTSLDRRSFGWGSLRSITRRAAKLPSQSLSRWIPLLAFLCVCCEIAAKRSRMMGKEENDR